MASVESLDANRGKRDSQTREADAAEWNARQPDATGRRLTGRPNPRQPEVGQRSAHPGCAVRAGGCEGARLAPESRWQDPLSIDLPLVSQRQQENELRKFVRLFALAISVLPAALGAQPDETEDTLTPLQQLEQIRSWEGRWQVAETPALQIVFEAAARGSAMIERWETSAGLHSMTIYHMDGGAVIATHYCPQGNQPRLESRSATRGEIRFEFRDVTGLDPGESHTHELRFTPDPDGTLRRWEVYQGEDGLQEPSSYTLSRSPADD